MFDFDVVTGPNPAELLRRKAEIVAKPPSPATPAPLAKAPAAPLSSAAQDKRESKE